MIKLYELTNLDCIKPNNICYTAVINACAYCNNQHNDILDTNNSLKIAIQTYKELQNNISKGYNIKPNYVTYINMLTALRNLIKPSNERNLAVKSIFNDACKNGYVNDQVIQRLQCKLTN